MAHSLALCRQVLGLLQVTQTQTTGHVGRTHILPERMIVIAFEALKSTFFDRSKGGFHVHMEETVIMKRLLQTPFLQTPFRR